LSNFPRNSRSNSRQKERHHHDSKNRRPHSRSRESSPHKRIIFDFEVFLEKDYIQKLTADNETLIRKIQEEAHLEGLEFDHDLDIPGLEGSVIKLQDKSYPAKYRALLAILKEVEKVRKGSKESISITILVPEGMVSLLIGHKGRQINNIMKDSHS
jgi:hypothetical protein